MKTEIQVSCKTVISCWDLDLSLKLGNLPEEAWNPETEVDVDKIGESDHNGRNLQNDALLEFVLDPLETNIVGSNWKVTVSLVETVTGQILRRIGTDVGATVVRRILTSVRAL